jgi:1-deoxy-D-xylulose-5-phosphate reductoisomerase
VLCSTENRGISAQVTQPTPRRRVVLLGATGSIGRQACDVIAQFPDRFELVGAVAGTDGAALEGIASRFGVARTALVHGDPNGRLPAGCAVGIDAACEIAAMDADVVCVAITGAAALRPTLAAIDAGATVATATKEVLVMAGELGALAMPPWRGSRVGAPARAHREWRSLPAPSTRHLCIDHAG